MRVPRSLVMVEKQHGLKPGDRVKRRGTGETGVVVWVEPKMPAMIGRLRVRFAEDEVLLWQADVTSAMRNREAA